MEDARALLKKIQTPIQRNVSRCGLMGVLFGLFLMFTGLVLLVVLLCWPESLVYWERNKCFAMQSSLQLSSIENYVEERLRAVIIDTRKEDALNQTYFKTKFYPFYVKAIENKFDIYMALHPNCSESINSVYSLLNIKGLFVDSKELVNSESIKLIFNDVNEHKVKYKNDYQLGLITEFGGIIDRYYFDSGLFMVHSSNSSEVLSLTQKELKKGKVLIGFPLTSFDNDIQKIFEISNYVDTFCESNNNFVGYVIIFD